MLKEAGGEFIALHVRFTSFFFVIYSYSIQHSHYRDMLLETARELGAETRTNAEVVEVAKDCRSVRLASGEVLKADVIIGADGSHGICRAILLPHDPPKPTGITLFKSVLRPPFSLCYVLLIKIFSSVIPADRIYADPELRSLVEQDQVIITYRFVKIHLILATEDFTMGMVWARKSIDLLPYRMSWRFLTGSPSQLLARARRETSHGIFMYEMMEQKKDGTTSSPQNSLRHMCPILSHGDQRASHG